MSVTHTAKLGMQLGSTCDIWVSACSAADQTTLSIVRSTCLPRGNPADTAVRRRNLSDPLPSAPACLAVNILLQTVMDAAVSAVAFYILGYGFAYGIGNNPNGFVSAAGWTGASASLPCVHAGRNAPHASPCSTP